MKTQRDPYFQHPRAYKDMNPNLVRLFRYQHRTPPLRPATQIGRILHLAARIALYAIVACFLLALIQNIAMPAAHQFHFKDPEAALWVYMTIAGCFAWRLVGWRVLLFLYDLRAESRAMQQLKASPSAGFDLN